MCVNTVGLLDRDEVSQQAKKEKKERFKNLRERSEKYKKFWDKTGVIQFKNERIAILRRTMGLQVEFIIAFDDLTKNGYRLLAHDEGTEGSVGPFSGGINSYFYFQRMEYVH